MAVAGCTGDVAEERVVGGGRNAGAHVPEAGEGSDSVLASANLQARLSVESDRALAEQGDAGAQARLGEAYYLGRGAAQDFAEALRWARLAAEQGDARGQGVLASAYNTGSGVAADPGEALHWARLAAEQGGARGQAVLGFLYSNGRGVPQDDAESLHWTRLAAEQGNRSAQGLLGMKYMAGRGVEQDFVTGYMWLTLSGSNNRVRLAQFMTPEQIAEAETRAREWARVQD